MLQNKGVKVNYIVTMLFHTEVKVRGGEGSRGSDVRKPQGERGEVFSSRDIRFQDQSVSFNHKLEDGLKESQNTLKHTVSTSKTVL